MCPGLTHKNVVDELAANPVPNDTPVAILAEVRVCVCACVRVCVCAGMWCVCGAQWHPRSYLLLCVGVWVCVLVGVYGAQ